MSEGDTVIVGFQSWAGVTNHKALVIKVCPKRIKVKWLDDAPKRPKGTESYVPKWAATPSN